MKKKLVLIHGFRGDCGGLAALGAFLAPDFNVLIPDLPGIGNEPPAPGHDFDAWLLGYIKKHGLERPVPARAFVFLKACGYAAYHAHAVSVKAAYGGIVLCFAYVPASGLVCYKKIDRRDFSLLAFGLPFTCAADIFLLVIDSGRAGSAPGVLFEAVPKLQLWNSLIF